MKKLILLVSIFSLSSMANAGFGGWLLGKGGDVATSYIGAKMAGGGSCVPVNQIINSITKEETKVDIANNHLWKMHEIGIYTDNYKFYLKFLEKNSDKYNYFDTVAWVYSDNGDHKKALKIYENEIMPWLVNDKEKKQKEYLATYEIFKKNVNCIFGCSSPKFDVPLNVEEEKKKITIKKEKEEVLFEQSKHKIIGIAKKIDKKINEIID